MTTASKTSTDEFPGAPAPADPGWTGNPLMVGLPLFVVGSIALALHLAGYVSAAAAGSPLPIILAASGLGTGLTTLWAAKLGQSAVAGIFGIFSGFWLSYALLVFGLLHRWLAVPAGDVVHTQALFLISWLSVFVLLTLGTLRLPSAYTLLLVIVDVCFALDLIATVNASSGMVKAAGCVRSVSPPWARTSSWERRAKQPEGARSQSAAQSS